MSTDYTLLLNDNWDIQTDSIGNIATVTSAYAIAQNVANAVRLFTKDAYFNQAKGIPHFVVDIGQKYLSSVALLRTRVIKSAMAINGVASCSPEFKFDKDGRLVSGDIQITLTSGETASVTI